ncbi:Putative adhesin domain-containing protein OS=Lysinibacillus sphaericus OX=1421 GN=LS41612_15430 PE=4 SV=1 [Lysinibacillus sphaericus]
MELTLEQFISNGFVVESEHGEIDIEGTLNGQSQITSNFGDTTLDLQNKKSELGFRVKNKLWGDYSE